MAYTKKSETTQVAHIKPANIIRTVLKIKSTAPLMQNKFSNKAKEQMMATMSAPKADQGSKKVREPRNYDAEFKNAQHVSSGGWNGIPCVAFRAAMIDACRTVGIVMTRAKMAVFVLPDGFDAVEGTPLVRIISKKGPEKTELPVRNDNGSADIRVRPMWREWEANVIVEFDGDMITAQSVVNLLDRAGRQVGVGEGRPFSKNSVGLGLGTFTVVGSDEKQTKRKKNEKNSKEKASS